MARKRIKQIPSPPSDTPPESQVAKQLESRTDSAPSQPAASFAKADVSPSPKQAATSVSSQTAKTPATSVQIKTGDQEPSAARSRIEPRESRPFSSETQGAKGPPHTTPAPVPPVEPEIPAKPAQADLMLGDASTDKPKQSDMLQQPCEAPQGLGVRPRCIGGALPEAANQRPAEALHEPGSADFQSAASSGVVHGPNARQSAEEALHQPERGLQSAASSGKVHVPNARQSAEVAFHGPSIRKPTADDSPPPSGEGSSVPGTAPQPKPLQAFDDHSTKESRFSESIPSTSSEKGPASKSLEAPKGAEEPPSPVLKKTEKQEPEDAPMALAPAPVEPAIPAPSEPEPKQISEEDIVKELPEIQTAEPEDRQEVQETRTPPPPRPTIPPMYIVQITPELDPVAKVGGLADVVFGLSRELEIRGNSVEIILPKYDCMRYDHIWGLSKSFENLWVPWQGGGISCTVWFGFVHGRKCYFIEPHSRENFFNRNCIYGQNDDVARFAFFCRAALEFMLKTGKHPDIIHCHDWQTALVPVLLFEMYKHLGMTHPRVCFTIHNFRHQAVAGDFVLRATGLNRPEYFFHYDRLRDNHNAHAINLMKGGIVYSNFVTTVSPRHAWEAKDAGQGHGLEPTLHIHHCKYGGVLNGLDYEMYNPETDPYIPAQYNAATIQKKYDNKRALRNRFWLADGVKPIVAFIGRLDPQKGLDLVRHAVFYSLGQQAQFVMLGSSPDRRINDHFWGLKRHLNDNPDCHVEIGFNNELAHLIYAGADMMIVPSRFEPCGLTQLISMRYGTVPIVRSVGGLADTVFDKDHANRPLHERNGYIFHQPDNRGIESALHRAIRCYYDFPKDFRALMLNGMKSDYSWNEPGQHYLNIYDYIRQK